MEVKLDSGVKTVLNALEMSKYIPVFEKYGISMKIFTSLIEEDLKTMGVEEEDLEPLLKYVKKLGRTDLQNTTLELNLQDIHKGINVIDEHLKRIDVSLCYTLENFVPGDLIDQIADEKTLSEIAVKTGDHIQEICGEFNDMIDEFLGKDVVKPEKKFSRTWMISLGVAAVAIAIYLFTTLKR